jgi:hypothetical protein
MKKVERIAKEIEDERDEPMSLAIDTQLIRKRREEKRKRKGGKREAVLTSI